MSERPAWHELSPHRQALAEAGARARRALGQPPTEADVAYGLAEPPATGDPPAEASKATK